MQNSRRKRKRKRNLFLITLTLLPQLTLAAYFKFHLLLTGPILNAPSVVNSLQLDIANAITQTFRESLTDSEVAKSLVEVVRAWNPRGHLRLDMRSEDTTSPTTFEVKVQSDPFLIEDHGKRRDSLDAFTLLYDTMSHNETSLFYTSQALQVAPSAPVFESPLIVTEKGEFIVESIPTLFPMSGTSDPAAALFWSIMSLMLVGLLISCVFANRRTVYARLPILSRVPAEVSKKSPLVPQYAGDDTFLVHSPINSIRKGIKVKIVHIDLELDLDL